MGITVKPRWSDDELSILKEYYSIGGSKLCQEKGLNFNSSAISSKAKEFGLYLNTKSDWTDDEILLLKEYYPKGGVKLCKEKGLNRSESAIQVRASVLGVEYVAYKEAVYWSEEELYILKKYYPKGGADLCISKGLKRSKDSIRKKVKIYFPEHIKRRLRLNSNNPNVWVSSEYALLKKYYAEGGTKLCKEKGLDRSSNSIRNKAREEKEKVEDLSKIMKLRDTAWSDNEINILKKYYPQGGTKLCIEKGLNRTSKAILKKAEDLGIKYK